MEDCVWFDRGIRRARGWEAEHEALDRPTILLVEDDNDIRDLLTTLLELAGYVPVACCTAEEGLDALREQPFDLVLTDYMLPNRTGAWLLQQAADEGLLEATPALVVTAHPSPGEVAGAEIITKPFDLDDLVDRVRQRLDGAVSKKRSRQTSIRSVRRGQENGGDDCPDPIELILHISAHSPWSAKAIENIRQVLTKYKSLRLQLTIHDLSKDASKGVEDGIAFTPTLVKRSPGPRTFILGHITNPELLLELLEGCEER